MNAIFRRVSVRKFQDRPVTEEQVERLLRAAMAAPSATNQQPWEFMWCGTESSWNSCPSAMPTP